MGECFAVTNKHSRTWWQKLYQGLTGCGGSRCSCIRSIVCLSMMIRDQGGHSSALRSTVMIPGAWPPHADARTPFLSVPYATMLDWKRYQWLKHQ